MTAVQAIERQIAKLSPEELAEFRAWFLERDWQAWERKLSRDVKGGKLEALARQARAQKTAGRTKPL
jgi:hypothetical protein